MIRCDGCGATNPMGETFGAGVLSGWPFSVEPPAELKLPAVHLCWFCFFMLAEEHAAKMRRRWELAKQAEKEAQGWRHGQARRAVHPKRRAGLPAGAEL